MITESLTIQVLHIISLALTQIEQWEAAKRYFLHCLICRGAVNSIRGGCSNHIGHTSVLAQRQAQKF